MNKEIKEILDKLPEEIDLKSLWYSERIKLLDYITNLQERIDKAIEYIDNSDILDIHHKNRHDLLDILKGEDSK